MLPFLPIIGGFILIINGGTACQYDREAGKPVVGLCQLVPRHDFNDPVLNQKNILKVSGESITEEELLKRAWIEYRIRVEKGDTRVVVPGTYAFENRQ